MTNNSGWCAISSDRLSSSATIGFSVTNVSLNGYSYDFQLNHDPDGDSDGLNASVTN